MARSCRIVKLCAPLAGVVLLSTAAGCTHEDATPIISGIMERDASVEITRDYVLVRAVPDHPDGFAVSREYWGPRVFEDGCPAEHLTFPMEFFLLGDQDDIDRTPDPRWRLLVWETNDPFATWVEPGEAYGTTAFEFYEDAYGSWAGGVNVIVDSIAADSE